MITGEQFKAAREAMGLSQEDAGLILHVRRRYIIRLEEDALDALSRLYILPIEKSIEAFIQLGNLLKEKKAPADLLHTPDQHYGGKSAIEYMKVGRRESILWVYASTYRLLN